MFAGIVAALRGAEPPELDHQAPARVTHPQHESSTFRYCTNFAVTGDDLGDASAWSDRLEELGDSVLVVGDPTTLKVHVHTDEPERAAGLFEAGGGKVSQLDVADMREQIAARDERLAARGNGAAAHGAPPRRHAACGALAVVAGEGMGALFEGLGLHTLDGGPTLNPSTYDLLAGIHAVPAEAVVVLPNSANVVMAAERAAELSDKRVVVVPTRSQQAGLAAAVALEPGHDADANAAGMRAALERVRTGAVAPAARDDGQGRFHAGDAVGFVDEQIVAWGEPEPTLRAVFDRLGDRAELLTCIAGDGAPLPEERVAQLAPTGVELECSEGGQPSYWWLVAAE
jgi:fatty acid kinase